jgi:hypothetical protein
MGPCVRRDDSVDCGYEFFLAAFVAIAAAAVRFSTPSFA